MRILQVVPELNSGGVERGTVEFARELVKMGHESWVLSNGGALSQQLHAEGSQTIELPVHRKSVWSLKQVRPVRQLLRELQPDIVHVRSRLPAWVVWLAWRKLPTAMRPGLVSTFHGNYSVNAYSAIMTRAERLIAISETARQTIADQYDLPLERLAVVHRGVDAEVFRPIEPSPTWREALFAEHPSLREAQIVMLPGRITRLKGHDHFIRVIHQLRQTHPRVHGVVVGGAEPQKTELLAQLEALVAQLGLSEHFTFLGNRRDMVELYNWADVVCHLSTRPEPFGRTLTEALACGTPVVAYDHGGPRESLQYCFPSGLVPPGDIACFAHTVAKHLNETHPIRLHPDFLLTTQVQKTVAIYTELMQAKGLLGLGKEQP